MPPKGRKSTGKSAIPTELPPCDGPKLHVFRDSEARIEWLERLDLNRDDASYSDGYIFKVRIKSKLYALKVFKFFDLEDSRPFWDPILGEVVSLETVIFHNDPFFAECRAYGRIKEAQRLGVVKDDFVVPCHGFLLLSNEDKRRLERKDCDFLEDRLDYSLPRKGGGRLVRAIVKDLAVEESGVDSKSIRKILRDIKLLNKLKIYNKDIREANYLGGKLVDFGSSWTEPHCALDSSSDWAAEEWRKEDLFMFDKMVEDMRIMTKSVIRATPNLAYRSKLRTRRKGPKDPDGLER